MSYLPSVYLLSRVEALPNPAPACFTTLPCRQASPFQLSHALHGTLVCNAITGKSTENAHSLPLLLEKATFRRAGVGPQTCVSNSCPGGSHAGSPPKKTHFRSHPTTFSCLHPPVTDTPVCPSSALSFSPLFSACKIPIHTSGPTSKVTSLELPGNATDLPGINSFVFGLPTVIYMSCLFPHLPHICL